MEGETGKAHLVSEKLEGPRRTIARIAHHSMTGKAGVAPDLMLAASQQVALNEGVMGASAKNPEAGLARDRPTWTFWLEAAPCLLRQGPGPEPPALLHVRPGEFSVEESNITLQDLVLLELLGEAAEGLRLARQEDNPARLPVEAMDWMNPEPGIAADPVPEVLISFDQPLKDGTETLSPLLLDAQPRGLLDYEPALIRV